MRRAIAGTMFGLVCSLMLVSPALAIDLRDLPDWVRESIEPVHINWAEVYPGLVGPSAKPSAILKPVRMRGAALVLTWKGLMEQGELDQDSLSDWIAEHTIDRATLIEALDSIPFSLPMDPMYLPICEAVWERVAQDVDACLEVPYAPRIYMATYLGTVGREEDAKTILSSIDPGDRMKFGARLYNIANELCDHQRAGYRLAIWCHKRGAELRGPADRAWVCFCIRQECQGLGGTEVVREELIPWAEEALARPGSEVAVPSGTPGGGGSRWRYAVRELIWAYDYVGEPQKALERGEYWFQQAKERKVSPQELLGARLQLAEAYANAGKAKDAAQILQALLAPDASASSWLVRRAQTQLIELATLHPEIGDLGLPAPQLERISPDRPILRVRVGDRATLAIQVVGNTTFRVNKAQCTVPFVQTAMYWGPSRQDKSVQVIVLSVEPTEKALKEEGTLIIETNDAEKPEVELPVVIEVVKPPQ